MHVKEVLALKGSAVTTIGPATSVGDLLATLAEHNIGAAVVTGDGRSVDGIVSERDVVRALAGRGADLLAAPVSDIMTADVHTCGPDDEIHALAKTMTDNRFRHLPVLIDGALAGIVTIGDIVKHRIDELETAHDQLVGYINS